MLRHEDHEFVALPTTAQILRFVPVQRCPLLAMLSTTVLSLIICKIHILSNCSEMVLQYLSFCTLSDGKMKGTLFLGLESWTVCL
jgi:hypothetical protein